MGINILGTGVYLPEHAVSNDDLTRLIDTNDEWIKSRTGISSRRISGWEPTWYMGAKSAEAAIKKANINPEDIGIIIVSSTTNDLHTPSIASILQAEIGAVNAFAFDVCAACSGFVYALDTARRFLDTENDLKYALVIAAENLTDMVDFSDRSTCILFGDGAAAAIIEKSDKLYSSYLSSDGTGAKYLYARSMSRNKEFITESDYVDRFPAEKDHAIIQNGKEVYKFAVKALPNAFRKAAEKIGITAEDIDVFIPHQANIRIIETAAKSISVPMEKFVITLDHYGNTSSSSIPIALNEAEQTGRIKRGDKICLVGFGAGLTSAAVIIEY